MNGHKLTNYVEDNVGVGFADFMIKPTIDPITGISYPAYGFKNREEYNRVQPKTCQKILFGIKANAQINNDMHTALYSKIYSGCISFLISEKKARDKLLATKIGKKMKPEQRIARLMPHELTSLLINEIMNLKTKPTGVTDQIAVEMINQRMTKDKFSALEMGVYRMVQMENDAIAHRRNRGLNRKLTFFKIGGGR